MPRTLSATCVWLTTPGLIVTLDGTFGEPVDSYVNGSQVWLRDDGPAGTTLEWRLHPAPGYQRPPGLDTYDVFATVALALGTGTTPPASPEALWEGLEAFAAYGDEVEPAPLADAATRSLGIAPDAWGLVDHDVIGDAWERSHGTTSIVRALLDQLRA
jgi:hypothetical protein